jgi:hypothetical protein
MRNIHNALSDTLDTLNIPNAFTSILRIPMITIAGALVSIPWIMTIAMSVLEVEAD